MTTATSTPSTNGLVPYTGNAASPAGAAGGMLMPLASASQAAEAINAYETLKTAIVRPEQDIQIIQGRPFLKKSFWRRVAACFGLSLELVSEERLILDGKLAYRATYRAVAPNGRTMDGDGMCSNAEKGREAWPEHNVRATAHTRAKNRAISDIVGGGEVSAEEMPNDDGEDQRPQQARRQSTARQAAQPEPKPSAWNALTDADVLQALNHLDVRGSEPVHAFLREMRAEMKDRGVMWTPATVTAELAVRTRAASEWTVTPAGDHDAHDLSQLDTGMPGN